MHTDDADAPIESDVPPKLISSGMLATMRLLAAAALGVGAFLLYLDVGYLIAQRTADVPFCSWASWLDCSAVVVHPKWSHWFGVPVAAPAVVLYVGVLITLFRVQRAPREPQRWLWLFLQFAAVTVIGAAAWFIYVQAAVLQKVCQYCMAEHLIGVVLGLLIIAHARRFVPRGRAAGTLAAVVGLAVLIGGQYLYDPPVRERVVIGAEDEHGRYVEPDATVSLAGGGVKLNPSAHLLLGSADAKHFVVEMVDYTCPRCAAFHELLKDTLPLLGEEWGVIVVTWPLGHACNDDYIATDPHNAESCPLARLAHAVWLTEPGKYPEFHAWLFENHGEDLTIGVALAKAKELVDAATLEGYRADPDGDPERLLERDKTITRKLGVTGLPGVFVGESRFRNIPDTPDALADALREAAEEEEVPGP